MSLVLYYIIVVVVVGVVVVVVLVVLNSTFGRTCGKVEKAFLVSKLEMFGPRHPLS